MASRTYRRGDLHVETWRSVVGCIAGGRIAIVDLRRLLLRFCEGFD